MATRSDNGSSFQGLPAQIAGVTPAGDRYLVYMPWTQKLTSEKLTPAAMMQAVEPDRIQRTTTGSENAILNALSHTPAPVWKVKRDDTVRLRDYRGHLVEGKVISVAASGDPEVELVTSDGRRAREVVPLKLVYVKTGPETAFTPTFSPQGTEQRIGGVATVKASGKKTDVTFPIPDFVHESPTGAASSFLNAAGELTSLPDYQKASPQKRFRILLDYYILFVGSQVHDFSTPMLYLSGGNTLRGSLIIGNTACMGHANNLGILFSEAGYKVKLGQTPAGEGIEKQGHLWIEVTATDGKKGERTWIIDRNVTMKNDEIGLVIAVDELDQLRITNPGVVEQYWFHPKRTYADAAVLR